MTERQVEIARTMWSDNKSLGDIACAVGCKVEELDFLAGPLQSARMRQMIALMHGDKKID